MATGSHQIRTLIDKIDTLPPERIAEVEDFVDFIRGRDQDRQLTKAAADVSEASVRKVWDNAGDAAYDRL